MNVARGCDRIGSGSNAPFDFRIPLTIGQRIHSADAQLHIGKGYYHNYFLSADGRGRRRVASVLEPVSGRSVELETDRPGLQFYSGNDLEGGLVGKKEIFFIISRMHSFWNLKCGQTA